MPYKSKEQRKHRERKRSRERKAFVDSFKAKGCALCGYNKCMAALEFHHPEDNKKIEISQCWSMEAIKKEIHKCTCVCANCHREIHAGLIEGLERVKTVRVDDKQLSLHLSFKIEYPPHNRKPIK